jgi:hypothetical protein
MVWSESMTFYYFPLAIYTSQPTLEFVPTVSL